MPLYAKELGFSYLEVQLLATVYFLVITPATVVAGFLADKTGRPGFIVVSGMALNAVACALMGHLYTPPSLMADRVVQALGLATAFPIALGALSLALGVRRGVGSNSFIMASGMAAGSLAGGYIVEEHGYRLLFYSASMVSLLAAAVALKTRFPRPGERPRLFEALRRVSRGVWIVLAGLLARNTLATGVYAVLAVIFNKVLGLTLFETAVALSVNPVVQALASMPISSLAKGRELAVYSMGLAGTSLVFLIYYTAGGFYDVLAAQVVQGLSFAAINVAGNMYVISRTPEEIRYTASSLFGFFFNLGWITGTLAAGVFMDAYGPEAWLRVAIVGVPLVAALTYLLASGA